MQVLNTLWVGNELGKLEQLCVLSGIAAGHPYHVYSYEPEKLRGVPEGAEVRDARDVMPRERLVAYAECNSYALGANFWRYEMLRQGRGYWVDLDVLVLKPFDLDQAYVFGTEEQGTVNNAVMLAPSDSPLVDDLVSLPSRIGRPPWYGPRRSFQYFVRRVREGRLRVEDYPWGTFGPGLLGYLVGKHHLREFAAAPEVFYPISWRNVPMLYGPAEEVDAILTEKTLGIHLYNSQLRELAKSAPPAGSYMARQFSKFGVN